MKNTFIKEFDTVVIGTGAAGFNAAISITEEGTKSVCMVTEGVKQGTSRNTGSDKQTYYKLGLGGSSPDSVRAMAETLFAGGSMDGDTALCEAALSARCFFRLTEAGVPFPQNRYGEFVGYKTDHDPFARGTSAGPLTSKFMTEALEKKAEKLGVKIFDKLLAVEVLKDETGVAGLICLDLKNGGFVTFKCQNLVIATGGPAGIYSDSVYPRGHRGSTGLALMAGAGMQNLTEWQYGLASIAPRWNVSGTYMQVLPRFVSIDNDGVEREFLTEFFDDVYEALSAVFLKGYQWPFDIKKTLTGSSVVDLLVYRECVNRGRRVYLDFTKNPFGLENIEYKKLAEEAFEYLDNAGACFGTPIERLEKMNRPAIDLYMSKGVNIEKEYLEIALCSQHNNGGIAVDKWWQTSVPGLFAAGECAGTHGIARPGGSALNSGQVGSLRAAQFISASKREGASDECFEKIANEALIQNEKFCESALKNEANSKEALEETRKMMSACGAAIRKPDEMKAALATVREKLDKFSDLFGVREEERLYEAYFLRDTLMVQNAVLSALIDYAEVIGKSRGSSLYYDKAGDLREGLDEMFRFSCVAPGKSGDMIQELYYNGGNCKASWRPVRPIPSDDDFFENVWRRFREDRNIY